MASSSLRAWLWISLAVLAAGCNAPVVQRQAEVERFRGEMNQRLMDLNIDPQRPLTVDQSVELALVNSLDLRVRELALRLQDDQVRLAFSGFLPNASLRYDDVRRSNEALVKIEGFSAPGGGPPPEFSFEDVHQQRLTIAGTLSVLDFGNTYYGYQIALDRRRQERLLVERARQLLARDVRIAYARHAGAIREAKLADVAYQAASEVLRVAKSLERAKMTARAETSLVEAALAQAALELSLSRQRIDESRLVLSQLMSLPPGIPFTIIPDLPPLPPPPMPTQLERLEERALNVRPELAVQDLQRHMSINGVRKALSEFFPHLEGIGSYNWSNTSTAVNPGFFLFGYSVAHSLLDGGATIWRWSLAKHNATLEEQRTLLLSLGVLYEVQFRALRVQQTFETVGASMVLERSRKDALDRIISLYKEGLEDPAGAARSLADLTIQSTALTRAQTDYLVAWHELEAAALPETSPWATTQPTTRPTTSPTTLPVAQPTTQEKKLP